jgi:hypothetical protein
MTNTITAPQERLEIVIANEILCPYTGNADAYCSGNHRYTNECIGKRGQVGDDCKYLKLKK